MAGTAPCGAVPSGGAVWQGCAGTAPTSGSPGSPNCWPGRTPASGRAGSGPATRAAVGSRSPATSTGQGGRWPTRPWSTRSRGRWEELGYRGVHRETEQPETQGRIRHPGRPAGPDRQEGRRGHDHRRKDPKGQPGVSHIVQVMLYMYAVPRAIRTAPRRGLRRPGGLYGPRRGHTGRGGG